MKIRNKVAIFLLVLISFCIQIPIMAADGITEKDAAKTKTDITYLEDGSYIETELTTLQTRSTNTTAYLTRKYSSSEGVVLWYAKLTATFTYDGERANCESVFIEAESNVSFWKIRNTDCYRFGSSAYGEVTAKQQWTLVDSSEPVTLELEMWCDANGEITYRMP